MCIVQSREGVAKTQYKRSQKVANQVGRGDSLLNMYHIYRLIHTTIALE